MSNWPRWRGWTGIIIDVCFRRSVTAHRRKPKPITINHRARCPKRRDSNQTASGKPGAVQSSGQSQQAQEMPTITVHPPASGTGAAAAAGGAIGFILSLPVDAIEDWFTGGAGAIANPSTTGAMTAGGMYIGNAAQQGIASLAQTMSSHGSNNGGSGNKVPKSGVSGKEGAKNAPSWAKGQRPRIGESGNNFATRLMNEKYGIGNWKKGPGEEFNQIQKWADRSFIDPP